MTNPLSALRPITGYRLINRATSATVHAYEPGEANYSRARDTADRLNQQTAAGRYAVRPIHGA